MKKVQLNYLGYCSAYICKINEVCREMVGAFYTFRLSLILQTNLRITFILDKGNMDKVIENNRLYGRIWLFFLLLIRFAKIEH